MEKSIASQVDGFIGNVIQMPRALYYLIVGAGEYVRIEEEDDVSVIDFNKNVLIIEQIKDRKDKNPYTNASEDLWKTIYNWAYDWSKNNSNFTNDTKFILYSRIKGFKKGSIVEKIENACSVDEINEAYEFIKLNYNSNTEKNRDKYRPFILDEKNKEIIFNIIRNFKCLEPSKTLGQDLEDTFERYFSAWGDNLNIYSKLTFNWFVKKVIDEETKKINLIEYSKTHFNDFIYGELVGINKHIPLAFANDIPQYKFETIQDSNFIKQLNLIKMEDINIDKNIKDFLVWDTTLGQDSVKGRLTEDVLNRSYKNIRSRWEDDKEWIYKINQSDNDELKGFKLYRETTEKPVPIGNIILDGEHEKQASRGVCNHLANQDPSSDYSIGWHPNYEIELRKASSSE